MVCKEEVFNWFKGLSGAKRIELMCGLMSMCIPLEIRFFEAIIRDLAKKDLNALREAEIKANSFQELDTICKCDLLADKAIIDTNELKPNPNQSNCEMTSNVMTTNCSLNNTVQQSLQQSIQQSSQAVPIQDMTQMSVSANGTTIPLATNEMMNLAQSGVSSPAPASSNLSLLPSRSKLVVSLCLLSPTNRTCSTLAYKVLRQQLTAKNIAPIVMNYSYRNGCYNFDDLFSEILLLLTMAVHHPAFSYEQRDILAKQKEEVESTIESINSHLRHNASFTANAHHFQYHTSHQPTHGTHPPQALGAHTGHTAHAHHPLPHQSGAHQSSQQYPTHTHPYMPPMPYSHTTAVLPNMPNLRITSPVSTPSPTNSPSSSKVTAPSVAAISPIMADFGHISLTESTANQTSYVLTTGIPHQTTGIIEDCVKSCYNCGSMGHRGDECTAQTQDEATR